MEAIFILSDFEDWYSTSFSSLLLSVSIKKAKTLSTLRPFSDLAESSLVFSFVRVLFGAISFLRRAKNSTKRIG